jgi:hypothetical protein
LQPLGLKRSTEQRQDVKKIKVKYSKVQEKKTGTDFLYCCTMFKRGRAIHEKNRNNITCTPVKGENRDQRNLSQKTGLRKSQVSI